MKNACLKKLINLIIPTKFDHEIIKLCQYQTFKRLHKKRFCMFLKGIKKSNINNFVLIDMAT